MEREQTEKSAFEPIPEETDRIAAAVVDAAYHVHAALGPGLLESVYEACLCHELKKRGFSFKTQVAVPVVYDGVKLDAGLRLDILVADCVIVELKAVEKTNPLFEAQLLTYLKLSNHRLGLLVNFNVPVIREGIRRIIH
ncbi:MAG TPA: GxxExxY protein [Planctomycetota bacterium]|nr:GxxExxY protein [Planctomycetota bacterium]